MKKLIIRNSSNANQVSDKVLNNTAKAVKIYRQIEEKASKQNGSDYRSKISYILNDADLKPDFEVRLGFVSQKEINYNQKNSVWFNIPYNMMEDILLSYLDQLEQPQEVQATKTIESLTNDLAELLKDEQVNQKFIAELGFDPFSEEEDTNVLDDTPSDEGAKLTIDELIETSK